MTVSELITCLQAFPPDTLVLCSNDGWLYNDTPGPRLERVVVRDGRDGDFWEIIDSGSRRRSSVSAVIL